MTRKKWKWFSVTPVRCGNNSTRVKTLWGLYKETNEPDIKKEIKEKAFRYGWSQMAYIHINKRGLK